MTRSRLISYSLLSGFLLVPAWSKVGPSLLLLFALVPLFLVEDYLYRDRIRHRPYEILLYSSLTFFVWNFGTTFWILNATYLGILAILVNVIRMSVTFWLFHVTRRITGSFIGYLALIAYWLVYEHFHMNCEVNWSWVNLGNGLAKNPFFIQWYEYTGVYGGTLWILLSNILVIRAIRLYKSGKTGKVLVRTAGIAASVIVLPIVLSAVIFSTYREKVDPREIVVIQPNIEPYHEKFRGMGMDKQMDIFLRLSDSLVTGSTDYIVGPETFINDSIWEDEIYENRNVVRLKRHLIENYPQAACVLGIHFMKKYLSTENFSDAALKIPGTDTYFERFNAAIYVDTSTSRQIYRKSNLTVMAERIPYSKYLAFLRHRNIPLGGMIRNYGIQEQRSNFYSTIDSTGISPVICYESIFGEYVTDYVKKGSDLIFVITNDGWWGDTPGYRQHHSYAKLRAIENRRSIAHCGNTGISSLINQKGQVVQTTEFWEQAAIRGTLNRNDRLTFYSMHGDYIARIAYVLSLLILIYMLIRAILSKKQRSESTQ